MEWFKCVFLIIVQVIDPLYVFDLQNVLNGQFHIHAIDIVSLPGGTVCHFCNFKP